ncbi:MAG: hypothetical protein VKJ46_03890, partial [Leptolyngbyaceae bacterium]|nr:hypothetical protein [Leptolyngbyaceae bacterium]
GTLEACRNQLQEALEDWILLGLRLGHYFPVLNDINLNPSEQLVSSFREDYAAYEETAYLLRSPKNAQRLMRAIVELESGSRQQRELIE